MEKLLSQIEKYTLYTIIFLFPFVVFSSSPNPYVVPKLTLLVFGLGIVILAKSIRTILKGKLELSLGTFDFPVLIIAISYLLSTIFRTPNKMEALLLPGTTTFFVGGAILYYLVNQLKESEKSVVSQLLFYSAAVYSVLTLLAFSGVLGKLSFLPLFYKTKGFTPEGGYIPTLMFLGVMLPIGVGKLMAETETTKKILGWVSTVIVGIAFAVSVYQILPGRPFSPNFPSFNTSWSIAVDSLKSSPLLGVGPGNYLTAFNRFRPLEYNNTNMWALRFTTARSAYITIFTEAGILALAALVLIALGIYKKIQTDFKEKKAVNWGFSASSSLISVSLLIIALLFTPATGLIIVLLFILLSLNSESKHTTLNLMTQSFEGNAFSSQGVASRFPALLITIPVIVFLGFFFLRATKIVSAEYKFQKALNALSANNATETYDSMREAISLNPMVDRYHSTFSRINLALANAIAQKATSQENAQQLSDQDRSNITTLIQQAINEAKAGVALNPYRSGNWEILGQTYRSITGLAKGADDFAVQAYRQAVALDPINPNLRIALGGVYFAKQDYENAVNVFQLAASAKPDLANAHYNYALALDKKGSLDQAISEMTLTLSLITDKDSKDYQVAKTALENVQAKKKSTTPQAGQELTSPQAEVPSIQPKVELPEGTEPPNAIITPTVTPSPEPTVVPTTEGGLPLSPSPTVAQ